MNIQATMNRIERILATMLAVVIGISIIPIISADTDVVADTVKNQNNTCLGASRIVSPVTPSNKDDSWQGSYVYFGSYNNNPIRFRVLTPSTTIYGGNTMFLDSDSTLFNHRFDDIYNDWASSELRTYLNTDFFTNSFDTVERSSIATSVGDGGLTYGSGSYAELHYSAPVSISDNVFLLDASEVLNPAYGYSSSCGWIATTSSYGVSYTRQSVNNHIKSGNAWWLRSGYSNGIYTTGHGGTVEGALSGQIVHLESIGVAPAININLGRVLFSTAVSGEIGALGTEYTLTVLDDNLSVVPETVSVSGSTMYCSATGNGNQVSILITDGAWDSEGSSIVYYGAYTGSFDLSSIGLSTSDFRTRYHIYLVAEQINSINKTDYACVPVELIVPLNDDVIPNIDITVDISFVREFMDYSEALHFYHYDAESDNNSDDRYSTAVVDHNINFEIDDNTVNSREVDAYWTLYNTFDNYWYSTPSNVSFTYEIDNQVLYNAGNSLEIALNGIPLSSTRLDYYHVYESDEIPGMSLTIQANTVRLTFNNSFFSGVEMYRLYNPNSGEHFYTSRVGERDMLIDVGWDYEGIGWYSPVLSNTPVYRLYNQYGGEHHYTTSLEERNSLIAAGWNDEGIGWYSDDACTVPLYRQYNPNEFANNHNYTTSQVENDYLISIGWRAEGIGWYGCQ